MKLTGESKIFLGIIGFTVLIIAVAVFALTKPAPVWTKEDLVTKTAYVKGDANAKTYLVEFSDFQCPACLAVKPYLDNVLKTYGDKIQFVYRNFPLDQHPMAKPAAQAAEAAGLQGKYWEMYTLLFNNQANLSEAQFPELAKILGLDLEKFSADMKSSAIADKIQADIADGTRFGVNATPTFFLNGKKLELASFDDLATAVEQAVK
jgi:protein-disulfide isomerase